MTRDGKYGARAVGRWRPSAVLNIGIVPNAGARGLGPKERKPGAGEGSKIKTQSSVTGRHKEITPGPAVGGQGNDRRARRPSFQPRSERRTATNENGVSGALLKLRPLPRRVCTYITHVGLIPCGWVSTSPPPTGRPTVSSQTSIRLPSLPPPLPTRRHPAKTLVLNPCAAGPCRADF